LEGEHDSQAPSRQAEATFASLIAAFGFSDPAGTKFFGADINNCAGTTK
jgi:hypothetical protein